MQLRDWHDWTKVHVDDWSATILRLYITFESVSVSSSLPIHTMLLQQYYHALLAFAGSSLCEAFRNIRFDPRKLDNEERPATSSHKQRVLELERRQNPQTTAGTAPVSETQNANLVTDVGSWGTYFHERSWCWICQDHYSDWYPNSISQSTGKLPSVLIFGQRSIYLHRH